LFNEFIYIPEGHSNEIVKKEAVIDDPQRRQPDITVARENLNWEPTVALDEGLAQTIDYFKNQLEQNKINSDL
jgi:nucleoside-diphosphate-sugar epimerase